VPSPAPEAERLAGGVEDDPASAASARPRASRAWRWAGAAVFLLVIVVLFDAYLHLSKTYAENSDEANILLMANDMRHGNLYLSGWNVSDVPFITTELPEIAVLVYLFGLHLNTAHIAAALTYTLVIAVAMLLAKGRARGPQAIMRMALVLAIMLAPQPGVGVFVLVFSVGHIGTALPVMLTLLVLDRFGFPPSPEGVPPRTPTWGATARAIRRRWYVPVIAAVMLAWAEMADPLVLVVAILPLLAVCLARVVTGAVIGIRNGRGLRGLGQGLAGRWLELSLAAAAGIGYLVARWGGELLVKGGGFHQQAVPYLFDGGFDRWFMQARVVVHGLLEMFGAYFVPGDAINFLSSATKTSPATYVPGPGLSGFDEAVAITHLAGVLLAIWGACAIARRFFFRDADFVSQVLLVGIIANLAAYIPSTLADHTALNVREIAPVLPFAAVLAGRMLGDRLLALGPLVTVRLPGRLAARLVRWRFLPSGRILRLRLIVVPMVVLFGWFSLGLLHQADKPAAPNPLAGLEAFLEANGLSYGISGYWDASVITVDTGGAVTIRAVSPSCLQPYAWENKPEWYNSSKHVANFLLLANVPGYFSGFGASGDSLNWLILQYPNDRKDRIGYGNEFVKITPGKASLEYDYDIRIFQGNLLAQLNPLDKLLNGKPADANKPAGPTNPIVAC